MSNYGFATYDEKNSNSLKGVVNSKWPVFGPKYSDIKKAFRTIHITDTKQYAFRTSPSVVLPPAEESAISEYHGKEKILVMTIPHGYKFRPVGYATISGSFVKNTRGNWLYTNAVDYYGWYPPSISTPLEANASVTGYMQSGADGLVRATSDTGNFSVFSDNMFDNCGITYPEVGIAFLTDNSYAIPGDNSSVEDFFGFDRLPYSIEIDDTNVYLYRNYYWSDVYKRDYYNSGSRVIWDLRARMSGIIDYAGSDFDLTIYLCPYRMEDMV